MPNLPDRQPHAKGERSSSVSRSAASRARQAGDAKVLTQRCQDMLAAVAALSDGSGQTMATDQQLGERASISSNVVRKALAELEMAGYLMRETRRGRRKITLTSLAVAPSGGGDR
jgi:hypothetical protein